MNSMSSFRSDSPIGMGSDMERGKLLDEGDMLSLPNGTVISHRYGKTFISESWKKNAGTFIEDASPILYVAPAASYEDNEFIDTVDLLPPTGEIVIYGEEPEGLTPDCFTDVRSLHGRFREYKFVGKLFTP